MRKKKPKVIIKKRVISKGAGCATGKPDDKVEQVMHKFKKGSLKDSAGHTVTDRSRAIAIALSEAGLSKKTLEKAEILSKVRVYKGMVRDMYLREVAKDESLKNRVLKFFRDGKNIDEEGVHAFAEKHGFKPVEVENIVYQLLGSIMSKGTSAGGTTGVDPKQLKMGIAVEMEHADDPNLSEKIARDHLAEDDQYYTKLKEMEAE